MSEGIDTDFLIRMAATAIQWMPPDWVPSGPILGPLLDLADLPLCAAPHPDASRALEALGARLPVARAPQDCWPASIGLLVLQDPREFSTEWRQALAPGALVFTRNTQQTVVQEDGALNVLLEFEAGISLDLCEGGHAKALRAFVEDCVRRRDLTAAVIQMALVLQGKHAHLVLATEAASRREVTAVIPPDASATPIPDKRGGIANEAWPVRLGRWIGRGRQSH
jgi:hypothetical protein